MLKFDNWALIADGKLLARERDNLTTTLLVSGDLPQGWTWDLLVTAGQNRNIIRLEEMTGGVGVVLTAEMLAEQGYYRMQLRGTRGEEVKHSNITSVYVGESMSGDKMWPTIPSEFSQLEARVNADADRAEDAAQAAEDAAIRQPYPNPDTGTWWTWDAETGAYKDTGEPYSGGGSGEAGQDGGYYAPSVDDDGNLTWTPSKADMPPVEGANIKGPAGATGATPNLQIGEVTTLDAGSDATASITGTAENPLLNLGIPKGADGAGGGETWVKIGDYTWSAEDAAAENVPNIFFTQDVEGNPLSFDAVIVECEPLCAANRIMYMLFPDKDNLNQNKNYVFAGSNMLRNGQHEFVRVDLYSSPTPHAISHCNLSGNCKQNGGTQGAIVVWEPVATSYFIYPANAVRIFPSGQLLEGSKFTVWGRKVNV